MRLSTEEVTVLDSLPSTARTVGTTSWIAWSACRVSFLVLFSSLLLASLTSSRLPFPLSRFIASRPITLGQELSHLDPLSQQVDLFAQRRPNPSRRQRFLDSSQTHSRSSFLLRHPAQPQPRFRTRRIQARQRRRRAGEEGGVREQAIWRTQEDGEQEQSERWRGRGKPEG